AMFFPPRAGVFRPRLPCVFTLALSGMLAAGAAGAQVLDTGFAPSFNDIVRAIAVQPDGRILVGGDFSNVNGSSRYALVRLLDDGSLDPGFAPPNLDDD